MASDEEPALDGHVSGYAALFGRPDQAGDTIERGAFAVSLKRRGAQAVRMLWQHDTGRPVGVWTEIREDAKGLLVCGRLAMETAAGREAAGLLRSGALDGLSIGFRTVRARAELGRTGRRLLEVDLWEVSLVTFPMQEAARVTRAPGLLSRLADRLLADRLALAAHRIASAT